MIGMKTCFEGLFLLACLIVFAAGCGLSGDPSATMARATSQLQTPTPVPVPVEISELTRGPMTKYIETTANIEAERDAMIYPKTSGIVQKIFFEEGDQIRDGDVLVLLEDDELRLRKLQAETTRMQASDKYSRVRELHDLKMISDESYQAARYEMESADVAWKLASLALDNTRIKSSISGKIVERLVSVGDLVQPSTAVFRIVDPESHIVVAALPQHEAWTLKPGMQAELIHDSRDTTHYPAGVLRISPAVDPKTGTVKVTLKPENPSENLVTGLFVRVRIIMERREAILTVPRSATFRENGNLMACVMNPEGKAEKRVLTTGLEDSDKYEVVSGLSENDLLITVGYQGLSEGAYVYDVRSTPAAGETASVPDAA